MLLQEHGAELAQAVGAVDEDGEDLVALLDREREQAGLVLVAALEAGGGVVAAGGSEHPGELD